MYMYT